MMSQEAFLQISKEDAYLVWSLRCAANYYTSKYKDCIPEDLYKVLISIYEDCEFVILESEFLSHELVDYLGNPIYSNDANGFTACSVVKAYRGNKTFRKKVDRESILAEYKEYLKRENYTCFTFCRTEKFSDDEWEEIMKKI